MKKIVTLCTLLLAVSLSAVAEKSVYFLLHGLYSSSQGWNTLIDSDNFTKSGFTYGGNFYLKENFFDSDKFDLTTELHKSLDKLLQRDNQVFTVHFASGYQNDFMQQAVQIAKVLDSFPETGYDYYFVGHSMGGLAARYYVVNNPNRQIKGLITIGTPHLGSYLGNINRKITSLLGVLFGIGKRPDQFLTGISKVWKKESETVIPSLVPDSDDLNELNSKAFPTGIKSISIFSAINTQQEIEDLHNNEQLVLQMLQVQRIKGFAEVAPTDLQIAKLYNDLYYTDGIGSIASQNLNNAIPNKYEIEAYHIPTRIYHDNEPGDFEHLVPAMSIIKQQLPSRNMNLFVYSSREELVSGFNKIFIKPFAYKVNLVVDVEDKTKSAFSDCQLSDYDYCIFLVDNNEQLTEIRDKIDSTWVKPIIIDFSIYNNIEQFQAKDCLYIKIANPEEGEIFLKFLSDMFSGKMYVKRDELDQVKEQILRYYFFASNMTERIYIPDYWWEDNLRFFQ